jgi:hypothetical protein
MEHATPAALLLIACYIAVLLAYIHAAEKGKKIFIRRIAGIDAIDSAIGRAIELGRSMAFSAGMTAVGPTLYACLGILRHIARKAAVFRAKLFVPCRDPEVLVLSDATLQSAYRAEKRLSQYDPSMVRFLSEEQFAYASGYMGLVHRENVGAAFLFGEFAAESLILAEAGQHIGTMQIAGTVSNEQIPFFLTACDYTLFGEEVFAAGAFLSNDPVQTGSLRAQDVLKVGLFAIILLGAAEQTWRSFNGDASPSILQRAFSADWSAIFQR